MSGRKRKVNKRSSTENSSLYESFSVSPPKRKYREADESENAEVKGEASTNKSKPEVSENGAGINKVDSNNSDASDDAFKFTADGKKIEEISPSKIRFTQETISDKFGDGSALEDTLKDLKTGIITVESIPKITVVSTKDKSAYFTHDNRRLCVFQKYEAHLGKQLLIPCIVGEPEDLTRKRITTNRRSLGKSVKIVKENYKTKVAKNKKDAKLVEEWVPEKIPKI